MLKEKDFYSVSSFTKADDKVDATITINAAHKIFEGHFPGHPVVPGVCMVQMIKELLEQTIEAPTQLLKADNLKFLAIINPVENNVANISFRYTVNEKEIDVAATISNATATNFKMKATFKLL